MRLEMWLASIFQDDWSSAVEYSSRVEAIHHAAGDLGLEPGEVFYVGRQIVDDVEEKVVPVGPRYFS